MFILFIKYYFKTYSSTLHVNTQNYSENQRFRQNMIATLSDINTV